MKPLKDWIAYLLFCFFRSLFGFNDSLFKLGKLQSEKNKISLLLIWIGYFSSIFFFWIVDQIQQYSRHNVCALRKPKKETSTINRRYVSDEYSCSCHGSLRSEYPSAAVHFVHHQSYFPNQWITFSQLDGAGITWERINLVRLKWHHIKHFDNYVIYLAIYEPNARTNISIFNIIKIVP